MKPPKKANVIYNYVRRGIETGKYHVGDRIPTERDLASQFELSRPTVSSGIRRLVAERLLRRNGKAGSVVLAALPRRRLTFGAFLPMLGRPERMESIFLTIGQELAHRAGLDHAAMLLRDPSWGDGPTDPDMGNRYREIADQFMDHNVTGIFLTPQVILPDQYVSPSAQIAEDFKKARIAVVLIDSDIVRYPRRSAFDLVGIDNFSAGYALATHFLNLGCRKIDFLAKTARHPTQQARIAGYQQAMADNGLPPDSAGVQYGDLHDEGFVRSTIRRRKPEVVLVLSDFRAVSVMRFILQAGLKIPQDIRLGSFDDLPLAAHLPVPLTTIRQPAVAIGMAAYQLMVQRLAEPYRPPMHLQLTGELVVRASSGVALGSTGAAK